MSGGDFLFIFSFIILPTAILVSAIWALIAIRAGVLLPPRPAVDLNEEYDVSDEPLDGRAPDQRQQPAIDRAVVTAAAPSSPVIEPSVPLAVSVERDGAVTAESGATFEPGASQLTTPGARHDIADPPAEQTLEMDAVETADVETRSTIVTPVQAPPSVMNVTAFGANPDSDATSSPTPVIAPSQVRSPSASATVPDDLDVVFVPANRAATTPASATNREQPDGTEPMAVERAGHDVTDDTVGSDDLSAITPNEALSDSPLPARAERDGGQRRGGRSLARRRQSDGQEPRGRILVTPPARRIARPHRSEDAPSVAQDEGLVQRGDGA